MILRCSVQPKEAMDLRAKENIKYPHPKASCSSENSTTKESPHEPQTQASPPPTWGSWMMTAMRGLRAGVGIWSHHSLILRNNRRWYWSSNQSDIMECSAAPWVRGMRMGSGMSHTHSLSCCLRTSPLKRKDPPLVFWSCSTKLRGCCIGSYSG